MEGMRKGVNGIIGERGGIWRTRKRNILATKGIH